jgi:hypothetical protein
MSSSVNLERFYDEHAQAIFVFVLNFMGFSWPQGLWNHG